MKRTKKPVADFAINASPEGNYTQIPNDLIRNPKISAKAKIILSILLSNRQGWKSHVKVIVSMMKEGRDAVQNGLKELEELGYLKRLKYREKESKRLRGWIWLYTDRAEGFDLKGVEESIVFSGFELIKTDNLENRLPEKPAAGKTGANNINNNNTKNKNINKKKNIEKKESKNISLPHFSLARQLSNIVSNHKNIKHTKPQIESWSREIRKLTTMNHIDPERIETALDWYEDHAYEPYIPVIESGSALRNKFLKLENAIQRSQNAATSNAYKSQKKQNYGW